MRTWYERGHSSRSKCSVSAEIDRKRRRETKHEVSDYIPVVATKRR
jgi:hypothetical protein